MNSADKLYELAKSLPEDQAAEILDFAEFLLQKRSRQSSTEVSTSTEHQPLDFRQAAGLGQEIWQSVNVEQYLQQERGKLHRDERSPMETVDTANSVDG